MLSKIKTYLIGNKGIEGKRIVTVDGGYRENPMTELWFVPDGATPPKAKPTVDPLMIKPSASKKPAYR